MGQTQSQISQKTDITKCSICLEEFKTPKCLPCRHTFCESCLNAFIISAIKSENTMKFEFNCPVCKVAVRPPDSSVKYQEWAKQFPSNHLIDSLIDQNKLEANVKPCDPCKSTNDDVKAVNWCFQCNEALCETCVSAHKKLKISKEHDLKNLSELKTIPLITSVHICESHSGKSIEAFCRDHDKPCCSSCVAIDHRKCSQVVTLEEAAAGIRDSKDLSCLLQRLKDTSTLNKTLIQEKLEIVQTMEDQKSKIEKELKEIRKKLIDKFDKLQSKFMQEFKQQHNNKVNELTDTIQDLENKEKVFQNFTDTMETGKTRSSEIQIFLEMKKILERERNDVEFLDQLLTKHKRVKYEFRLEDDIQELITGFQMVGQIDVIECSSLSDKRYPRIADP